MMLVCLSMCADTKHQLCLDGYESICVVKHTPGWIDGYVGVELGSSFLADAYTNLKVQEDECNCEYHQPNFTYV